jgi:hypothetical protein
MRSTWSWLRSRGNAGVVVGRRSRLPSWRLVGMLVVTFVLTGCGHSARDIETGWRQALQADLNAAYAAWLADTTRTDYPSNASAMRGLRSRYAAVYTRWKIEMDPLNAALLAYSVALWSRVDEHALSWEEARRLQDGITTDVARPRSSLPPAADSTADRSAHVRWWTTNWHIHRAVYEAVPAHPIACQAGSDATITCD